MVGIFKKLRIHLRERFKKAPKPPYWITRSLNGPGPWCVCVDPDTGKLDVLPYRVATSRVFNLGLHIIQGTATPDKYEAEKSLRKWARSPKKLQRVLEKLVIY